MQHRHSAVRSFVHLEECVYTYMYVCEVSGDVTTCRHKPSVRVPFRIGKKAKQFKKVSYIVCRHAHTCSSCCSANSLHYRCPLISLWSPNSPHQLSLPWRLHWWSTLPPLPLPLPPPHMRPHTPPPPQWNIRQILKLVYLLHRYIIHVRVHAVCIHYWNMSVIELLVCMCVYYNTRDFQRAWVNMMTCHQLLEGGKRRGERREVCGKRWGCGNENWEQSIQTCLSITGAMRPCWRIIQAPHLPYQQVHV